MGIQVIKGGGGSSGLNLAGGVALSASLISVVDAFANVSPLQLATASLGLNAPTFLAVPNWTVTLGIKDGFSSQQTVAVASAGTGVFRLIANKYTINNTGAQTGSVTGYFLNATETALNGITHNLMDLQVGGVSAFKVSRTGVITAIGDIIGGAAIYAFTASAGAGMLRNADIGCYQRYSINGAVANNACFIGGTSTFNLLQLGGTTSSFPAIKRNGAAIDFRLADDSGFCNITTGGFAINTTAIAGNVNWNLSGGVVIETPTTFNFKSGISGLSVLFANAVSESAVIGGTSINASAKFQVESITKGFLPPRMTTAQKNAIATPTSGLMVYDTTLNKLAVFTTVWETITSV